jgi:ADP-heptose:LPS heptosyltransferase
MVIFKEVVGLEWETKEQKRRWKELSDEIKNKKIDIKMGARKNACKVSLSFGKKEFYVFYVTTTGRWRERLLNNLIRYRNYFFELCVEDTLKNQR